MIEKEQRAAASRASEILAVKKDLISYNNQHKREKINRYDHTI